MLVLWSAPREAHGQSPLSFAPWEYSLDARQLDDSDTGWVLVEMQRSVPLASLLPQVSPDSRFDVMRAGLGARYQSGRDSKIVYRLTAIEVLLQRSFWSGGTTIADFNRSGLADLNADWFSISTGPGFHRQREDRAISFRVLLVAGYSTWRFGSHLGSSPRFNDTKSGLKFGLRGMFSISPTPAITLLASYHTTRMSGTSDLFREGGRVQLSARLSDRLRLSASHQNTDLGILGEESNFRSFGLSLKLISKSISY